MKIHLSSSRTSIRQICLQQSRSITSTPIPDIEIAKKSETLPENEANESSTSKSASSRCRPLPLSPYTLNASLKTDAPKPKRKGPPTPFQNQLARNPYGTALYS